MERRKSKILAHYNEIIDENLTLQENLEKILNQAFSCVELIKTVEVKQKDCSLISKYQLEVLKKLTEINYDLESIIEESPLKLLNISEKKYEVDTIVPEPSENINKSKLEVLETSSLISNQEAAESSTDTDFNSIACSSAYISELISGNVETQSNSGDDIQTLRDTLKKFSEKLGLNAECISSIKDFYQKPSTSCTKEIFDKPSSSQTHDFGVDNVHSNSTNFDANVTSNFEIPEKDTNVVINSEPNVQENSLDVTLPTEPCPDTSGKSRSNLNENSVVECTISQRIYTVDESSENTEADLLSTPNTEESSSEEPCTADSDVNRNNDLIPNTTDSDCTKSEDDINQNNKIVYTALEKLNNTKFFDRREEALKKMLAVNVPDIKLKPTDSKCSSVIKNDFQANDDNKLRKKRNKKKKTDSGMDGVFYELKLKQAPTIGTICAFSHVESPDEFYIHLVDDECALVDTITEQINEYFMNSVSEYTSKETASSMIGKYCFAFISSYDGWYRAKVLDWLLDSHSDEVLLQLVDYGNKRRTSYRNLRKMTKNMTDIPILAVRCHLPLMYPPNSTRLNRLTEWPAATIDTLVQLSGLCPMDSADNKLFKIVYAQQEGGSVAIDLYNYQEVDEEHTVGQILLDLGVAVQIVEDYDEEQLDLEVYVQDIEYLERAENINEAVIGYDPRDEVRICPFTKRDGSCFKGRHCKLEHVSLSTDGFTTDTDPVFKGAMYSLRLPAHDEVIRVLITGYKDTCNFFAQIVATPHNDHKYVIDKDLYMLLGDMNNSKMVSTYEPFRISPAIGEIVIVKHWSKKWLRAVVRERLVRDGDESEEYQVFTVDFGDYLKVPLTELRKIKPNFLQLPFQAVECYIYNYKAKKDCDPQKAKKFFYQNLYFQNFAAVAMSTWLPLKVGIKAFNGMDVGKTLAEQGFAEERIDDKNPIDGCALQLY